MEFAGPQWTALVGHPATHSDAIRGIEAQALGESGTAVFRYVLRADFSRLRIPQAESAARADGLWKHTCFEAFIRAPGAPAYHELNFSSSGHWAVYRFNAYREGPSSPALAAPPDISVRRFDDRLEVDAALHMQDLMGLRRRPHLRVALSAVVEDDNGTLSYWALKHPLGKPDFHHPDGFVLELSM